MNKDLKKLMAERSPAERIQVRPERLIPSSDDNEPKSAHVHKTTKPQVVKYTTHLDAGLIKAVKLFALESDMKDYEVVRAALEEYLNKAAK